MTNYTENTSRIMRNTMMLYIRMFILLVVSLFTSRLVINALGVTDYGVYNVVGGIVSMMTILNTSMSATIQRFLNYAEGGGCLIIQKQTFSASILVYILMCVVFVILAETIGLWFVNNKLVIPEDRMHAANCVYQFIILTTCVNFLSNPYNAVILANENMKVYAAVSVVEAVMKLVVAYAILKTVADKLIVYGALMLLVSFVVTTCYRRYCKRFYEEATFVHPINWSIFKKVLSFSGWTLFGSGADLVKDQGINVLLNLFFYPAVNAARGISLQINSVINQFFSGFYAAVKPQIVKYYASNDVDSLNKLIVQSGKISFFLILMVAMPIVIETPLLIRLWLGNVPDFVVAFSRLMIMISAIDAISSPLMTTANATGNIVLYQLTLGLLKLIVVPLTYVVLSFGFGPSAAFIVSLLISVICLIVRIVIVHSLVPSFSIKNFVANVLVRSFVVCFCSSILPVALHHLISNQWIRLPVVLTSSILITSGLIYSVGLTKDERRSVLDKIKNIFYMKQYESNI